MLARQGADGAAQGGSTYPRRIGDGGLSLQWVLLERHVSEGGADQPPRTMRGGTSRSRGRELGSRHRSSLDGCEPFFLSGVEAPTPYDFWTDPYPRATVVVLE